MTTTTTTTAVGPVTGREFQAVNTPTGTKWVPARHLGHRITPWLDQLDVRCATCHRRLL